MQNEVQLPRCASQRSRAIRKYEEGEETLSQMEVDMERQGKRVLVVDDEPGARGLLILLLSQAGYEVDEAINGVEALNDLMQRRYDVMITDYHMPGLINGWELMWLSRQIWPRTPVVLMSGDPPSMVGTAGTGGRGMGYEFLQKPYESAHLLNMVQAALERAYAETV